MGGGDLLSLNPTNRNRAVILLLNESTGINTALWVGPVGDAMTGRSPSSKDQGEGLAEASRVTLWELDMVQAEGALPSGGRG